MRRRAGGAGPRRNRRPQTAGTAHRVPSPHSSDGQPTQQRRSTAPWHFWLVVVMATVYLGWRAVDGVVWLVQWFADVIG